MYWLSGVDSLQNMAEMVGFNNNRLDRVQTFLYRLLLLKDLAYLVYMPHSSAANFFILTYMFMWQALEPMSDVGPVLSVKKGGNQQGDGNLLGNRPSSKFEFTILQNYSLNKRLHQETHGIIIHGITFFIMVTESFQMGYTWPSYLALFSYMSWLAMAKSIGSLGGI